jgi:RNA polymerase sigma-70 factor (ECF subfamily)
MTDLQIIELYWQRNEDAIRESDDKYGRYCFTVANAILLDELDSEECVSDTWLRAWAAIPPQRPNVLKMFFAKITRNLSVDRLKAKTAQKRGSGEAELILDELQECIASCGNAESEYMVKELGRSINGFVRNLPEREGNLFIRRYFYGESVEAIAKRYGILPHNAAVILSRVRQKLRRHLEKEGFLV